MNDARSVSSLKHWGVPLLARKCGPVLGRNSLDAEWLAVPR